VPKVAFKVDFFGFKRRFLRPKIRLMSINKLPNFKGRACKLDFSALHKSNFAAYFTGCQIKRPQKAVKVDFWGSKGRF